MNLRVVIFLEVLWLFFWLFRACLGIALYGQPLDANFLWNNLWLLLSDLFVGVGPLALTILLVKVSNARKN